MSLIAGVIDGVTLIVGNPGGTTALNSTTVCKRKSFLVMAHFQAYTGSTDSANILGICTAIANSERNGATLTLISVIPAIAGADANAQGVHFDQTSHAIITLSNTTTTGDAAANLTDASGTEVTATSGTTIGVGVIATVDEVGVP